MLFVAVLAVAACGNAQTTSAGRVSRGAGGDGAVGGESSQGGAAGAGGGFSVPALLVDDSEVTMASPDDVPARRDALIDFLWGPTGLPTWLPTAVERGVVNPIATVPVANLDRVDRLVIEMDQGITNEAFHFVPVSSNGRLFIVHGGHAYTLDGYGFPETIAALVARGYGVLAGQMPCYSSFACPGIPQHQSSPHNRLIAEVTPQEGSVLKYFVEHLVVSLNYLKTQAALGEFAPYHDFSMAGLSGGGWTTTLYAALDPTISRSFPCSGGKPMYLRHCQGASIACLDGYSGDAEQMHFPLYKHVAGYLDLYALGAAGAGRRQVQVQIRRDSCCFGEKQYGGVASIPGLTWNQAVRAYERKVQQFLGSAGPADHGWYSFEIDETAANSHVISPTTLAQLILGDSDGDRQPVAGSTSGTVYAAGRYRHLWAARPDWVYTGFDAVGTPAVVEWNEATVVVVRDPSSALVVAREGTPWTSEVWAAAIASNPAAATLGGTELHVVAVGVDSRLSHWSSAEGSPVVQTSADPATPVVGTPVLLSSPAGLDVLVRRMDGGVQHLYRHGATWLSERVTTETFRGFPSGVLAEDGALHMYARADDDTLLEAVKPLAEGVWTSSSMAQMAGVPGTLFAGSPAAALDPESGDLVVVERLPSGDLGRLVAAHDSPGWAYQVIGRPDGLPPAQGTASLTFSPVTVPGGIYARGQEGSLWFHSEESGWAWVAQGL
ncbi:MAG: hypothetical protein IT373_19330 [Polyangiaceae bacterium]|nr:hypothetical protein [Polyangiaceae bacterium]